MGELRHAERLDGVAPELIRVLKGAVQRLPFNCTVSEGVRSKEQATLNYRHGRTVAELAAVGIHDRPLPGPKITWTLHSNYIDGKAVDVFPLMSDGSLDDGEHGWGQYDALYHAVMLTAAELRVKVRYGGDWDMDGRLREKVESDSVHFELAA